ncbi:MAG: putative rane protein [Gemmatimonadetes bacterium]|nr:putative rane protein [Gemmatimonadota bacterium]
MTAADLRPHDDRRWRLALVVVTAAVVVRLLFAALIELFPDEAYYWDWSRHLAAGYFDHPPGIAILVRLGGLLTAPFGQSASPLGVRLGAVLAGWIAATATVATARRLSGDGAALRAAVLITVMPLAAAGLILATPDAPLLAATAAGLYCVVRALESPVGSAISLRWWSLTGVALGVAFASKYTSIFLPVGVVLAIVLRPELRARLREPGPYVACVVATVVFSPVLVWNAHHGWISFVYQVRHGLGAPQGSALLAAWKHEGDFFGGQAGLASPILFVMMVVAVVRSLGRRASAAHFVLAMVAALSFGFFVYSAVRQRVEPNWPAPAYIPAIVLLATMSWSKRGEKWLGAGIALAALLSVVIYVQGVTPILPLAPAKDPIARAYGWHDVTVRADSVAHAATADNNGTTWLGGDRYQEAAELAIQDPAHPTTFAMNLSGRPNQYDLWPRFPDRAKAGDNLVLVLDESDGPHDVVTLLAPYFQSVRLDHLVSLRRGEGEVGQRRLWLLSGWRGGWPSTPVSAR